MSKDTAPQTGDEASPEDAFESFVGGLFDEEEEGAEAQGEDNADEEPEQQTEGEADAEEGEETEEEHDDSEDDKAAAREPDKVQAMLDKRKKQRDEARKERDELRQENEQLKAAGTQGPAPVVLPASPESPLANVHTAEELKATTDAWKEELKWCRENPQGGSRKGANGKDVEWDADRVSRRADQAMTILSEAVPERQAYLEAFRNDVATVGKTMPFLRPGHELHAEAATFGDQVLKEAPGIAQSPRHVGLLGAAFLGQMILAGKLNVVHGPGGVQLVKRVAGNSDGSGKPRTVVSVPGKKPVSQKPTPPPVRPAGRKPDLAERLASNDPKERFSADMDAFLDDD